MLTLTAVREGSHLVRIVLWIALQFGVAFAAFWTVALSESGSAIQVLAVAVFTAATVVASVGALWMMWAATRHKHPVPKVLLAAIVPYSFVWYYVEHANDIEIGHFKRATRIATTVVAMFTGVVFIARGGIVRFVAIPLTFLCLYLSYLVSERERVQSDR